MMQIDSVCLFTSYDRIIIYKIYILYIYRYISLYINFFFRCSFYLPLREPGAKLYLILRVSTMNTNKYLQWAATNVRSKVISFSQFNFWHGPNKGFRILNRLFEIGRINEINWLRWNWLMKWIETKRNSAARMEGDEQIERNLHGRDAVSPVRCQRARRYYNFVFGLVTIVESRSEFAISWTISLKRYVELSFFGRVYNLI